MDIIIRQARIGIILVCPGGAAKLNYAITPNPNISFYINSDRGDPIENFSHFDKTKGLSPHKIHSLVGCPLKRYSIVSTYLHPGSQFFFFLPGGDVYPIKNDSLVIPLPAKVAWLIF